MEIEEIKKTLDVFRTDNGLLEIRIFSTVNKSEIYSGIFDNDESLIREINRFDKDFYNIYFVFNELKDALNGLPQLNKMVRGAKTISDKDIKFRRWLLFDFDPIREGDVHDIASNNEEFENSKETARRARRFLLSKGIKQPVVCFSGNGTHLLVRIDDVPCNDETDNVCKNVLKYIAMQFTDDKVDCDIKVSNRARLTKFYSSISRKGGNTLERPHRKSEIVVVPPTIEKTPYDVLKKLSDDFLATQATDYPSASEKWHTGPKTPFNVDDFLAKNGIEVLKESRAYDGGRKIVLKQCPFDPSHGKDSAIFVAPNGAITFTCFHSGCSGNTWRTLRLKFDPHAYDKKEYEQRAYPPYQQARQYAQKPKYTIKEESEELGKKWLSLSGIKKIDLSSIESMKTGYKELDQSIVGLNAGEVSILSGGNGSGKSSWINNLMLNVINQGYKVALWSGELPPAILKTWIQMCAAGKEYLRPSTKTIGKYYVPNDIAQKIDNWLDGKFYLYNNEYSNKWEQIFNDMNELLNIGVKLYILDNLFSLDVDIFEGDKNNKHKELILEICRFAKTNGVHLLLVAHPRKSIGFLRKTDISGTADLTNAVDNVFICHRVNNDFFRAGKEFFGEGTIMKYQGFGNVIEIAKNRLYGAVDVMCGMHYEIESRRFKNSMDETVRYGWIDNTVAQKVSANIFPSQVQQEKVANTANAAPFAQYEGVVPF